MQGFETKEEVGERKPKQSFLKTSKRKALKTEDRSEETRGSYAVLHCTKHFLKLLLYISALPLIEVGHV